MNMKMNFKLLTSAVVLGMAIPAALPLVANAADTPADTASKSATVEVTGGNLTFTKDENSKQEAPSFQFKANVSTAAQTGLKATGYQNTDATDTYTGTNLSVDDDTGTGNGWHVTAQLGDFSDGASHSLAGAALNVNSASGSIADTTTATSATLTSGGAAATVFNAAAGKGMGTAATDLSGTTLDLPTAAYAGNYSAALTYTLTSGPTA